MTHLSKRLLAGACLSVMLLTAASAQAFDVVVKDESGKPIRNVAVALYPQQAAQLPQAGRQEVQQKNLMFDPFVSVVPLGTSVNFPNKDTTRHHVYSFSQAKRIDLPLFHGTGKDVIFDKEGVVSLGCNIHDWMLAYVVVVGTPYFASTNDSGTASISVPDGHYSLRYWYPGIKSTQEMVVVDPDVPASRGRYEISVPAGSVQSRPEKPEPNDDSSNY